MADYNDVVSDAIIYMTLDDDSGTNDGSFTDPTVSGDPAEVAGQFDSALDFDTTDYLQWVTGVDAVFQDLADWSFCGWFERGVLSTEVEYCGFAILGGAGGGNADSLIFCPYHKWGSSSDRGVRLVYRDDVDTDSGTMLINLASGGLAGNTGLNFFAVSLDSALGSNQLKCYINGTLRAEQTETETLHTTIQIVQLAARLNNSSALNGMVDDFAFWDRALSAEEFEAMRLHTIESNTILHRSSGLSLGTGLGLGLRT